MAITGKSSPYVFNSYRSLLSVHLSCLCEASLEHKKLTIHLSIVGLFLAAIVNNGTKDRDDTGCYRIPVGGNGTQSTRIIMANHLQQVALQFAWAVILVVGMLVLPETPRFLIKKNQPQKAAVSLSRLRRLDVDHPSIVEELAEIKANHQYELSIGKASYFDCVKGNLGKRLVTGCCLQALQQLSGVNFIFCGWITDTLLNASLTQRLSDYGTQYFKNAGFGNPFIITVITNSVNVASTFPGLYMVEKLGRRNLLLLGAVGMTGKTFYTSLHLCQVS